MLNFSGYTVTDMITKFIVADPRSDMGLSERKNFIPCLSQEM